jgi:hypothetical protein
MSNRGNPDAIIELDEVNGVRKPLKDTFPYPGGTVERKCLGSLSNPLYGLLDNGNEVIPQPGALSFVVSRGRAKLVVRLTIKDDGFHDRSRRH